MNASHKELFLLLVTLVALVCIQLKPPSIDISIGQVSVADAAYPWADTALTAEPLPPEELPLLFEAPVAVEGPKMPVQPFKERDDAMLFESEALLGTPFDQAIVMPFD
jgi:hypothetical protein